MRGTARFASCRIFVLLLIYVFEVIFLFGLRSYGRCNYLPECFQPVYNTTLQLSPDGAFRGSSESAVFSGIERVAPRRASSLRADPGPASATGLYSGAPKQRRGRRLPRPARAGKCPSRVRNPVESPTHPFPPVAPAPVGVSAARSVGFRDLGGERELRDSRYPRSPGRGGRGEGQGREGGCAKRRRGPQQATGFAAGGPAVGKSTGPNVGLGTLRARKVRETGFLWRTWPKHSHPRRRQARSRRDVRVFGRSRWRGAEERCGSRCGRLGMRRSAEERG